VTAATKVSTCVDCATPIIGERLRCPACHDQHAFELIASTDDDVTIPRDRPIKPMSVWQSLLAWFVVEQLFAVVVAVLILMGRGCR